MRKPKIKVFYLGSNVKKKKNSEARFAEGN